MRRLLTFIFCLCVGIATTHYWGDLRILHQMDLTLASSWVKEELGRSALTQLDSDHNSIIALAQSNQPDKKQNFDIVAVTDDPDRIFENTPPSALDYATIFAKLHEQGATTLVAGTTMGWDDEPALQLTALNQQIKKFDRVLAGVPLRRSPNGTPIPDIFLSSEISTKQLRGDSKLLPQVNALALPNQLEASKHLLLGFSQLESEELSDDHIQLIAMWDGHIIPSFELVLIMVAYDKSPEDLHIHLGQTLTLGADAPIINIDQWGRTPLALNHPLAQPTTSADALFIEAVSLTHPPLLIANGKKSQLANQISQQRLADTLATIQLFPVAKQPIEYTRLPSWAEAVIIIDLALLLSWLSGRSRFTHILSVLLIISFSYLLILELMQMLKFWLPVTPILATFLVSFLSIALTKNPSAKKTVEPAS